MPLQFLSEVHLKTFENLVTDFLLNLKHFLFYLPIHILLFPFHYNYFWISFVKQPILPDIPYLPELAMYHIFLKDWSKPLKYTRRLFNKFPPFRSCKLPFVGKCPIPLKDFVSKPIYLFLYFACSFSMIWFTIISVELSSIKN